MAHITYPIISNNFSKIGCLKTFLKKTYEMGNINIKLPLYHWHQRLNSIVARLMVKYALRAGIKFDLIKVSVNFLK